MTVISRRPPWPGRIGCGAFCTGLSTALIITNTGDYISGQAAAWVFAPLTAMVDVLMAVAWRVVTWSFRADAAGLVIHNILRTRRVPLGQVVGFDVGGSGIDRDMVSVRVITVSGTYRSACTVTSVKLTAAHGLTMTMAWLMPQYKAHGPSGIVWDYVGDGYPYPPIHIPAEAQDAERGGDGGRGGRVYDGFPALALRAAMNPARDVGRVADVVADDPRVWPAVVVGHVNALTAYRGEVPPHFAALTCYDLGPTFTAITLGSCRPWLTER